MRSRPDWVFIHVPKTGGTSIRVALSRSLGALYSASTRLTPHARARDYAASLGHEQWESFYRFAVVRHPLDRLVSAWAYTFKPESEQTVGGFRSWVAAGYPLHERYRIRLSGGDSVWIHAPQCEWLVRDGRIDNVEILRFESLQSDWSRVRGRLGCTIDLTHENHSERGEARDYYDAETRAVAVERYAEDFERLGYEP